MEGKLTARAPAKLILSGEHSVIYGQPALAMAVDRYTETTAKWQKKLAIHFKLLDLAYAKSQSLNALQRIRTKLQKDYHSFLQGECGIRDVLKKPFELLQFSVANLIECLNLQLSNGVEIKVNSNIPMGCGMGSSAAAIISMVHALAQFFKLDWKLSDLVDFGRQAENLQHGYSSGLDLQLATYGGGVRFQNRQLESRDMQHMPMYIVNTGQPDSTTGECVAEVGKCLKDQVLLDAFAAVTEAMDQAICAQNIPEFQQTVRENHRLLERIGVVPSRVAEFISAIEEQGGAAKICGAGAVYGERAGVVMISADQQFHAVAQAYGYELQAIQMDNYGTQII